MIEHCTRLSGLTLKKYSLAESPTVATYPSAGGQHEAHGCVFQGGKTRGVATNIYSRKMLGKTKSGSTNLKDKCLGVV